MMDNELFSSAQTPLPGLALARNLLHRQECELCPIQNNLMTKTETADMLNDETEMDLEMNPTTLSESAEVMIRSRNILTVVMMGSAISARGNLNVISTGPTEEGSSAVVDSIAVEVDSEVDQGDL
jgi:hypothetical protein